MQTPVVLPEDDLFDHLVDEAHPLACICEPCLEPIADDQLADTPLEWAVVHKVVLRGEAAVA